MNRRSIITVAIGLAILGVTVWRGCHTTTERVSEHTPSARPSRANDLKHKNESTLQEKSIEFAKRNNYPIAFYGRVVDQDGKPPQGVTVNYQVST